MRSSNIMIAADPASSDGHSVRGEPYIETRYLRLGKTGSGAAQAAPNAGCRAAPVGFEGPASGSWRSCAQAAPTRLLVPQGGFKA